MRKIEVKKSCLLLLAGLMWTGVGIMLNSLAAQWLSGYTEKGAAWFAVAGVILALLVHHFGFLRIVNQNLQRIANLTKERVCAFAFMPLKSDLLVGVMISLGIVLRKHTAIPKEYLAIVYIGIGSALLLSSVRYYRNLIKKGCK